MPLPALAQRLGLPARWQGRPHAVVLVLGFDDAVPALSIAQAWRDDPGRCERLVIVAPDADRWPRPAAAAGTVAPAWADAWPARVAGWHALSFDGGRMRLHLRRGPLPHGWLGALKELALRADAIVLGAGPGSGGDIPLDDRSARWLAKALARAAAPQATLLAEDLRPAWRQALQSSGFQIDPPADDAAAWRLARFSPRHAPATARPPPSVPDAVIVGAGLAGAAAAAALSGWGGRVQVLDRRPAPALEASGNLAGLYHGVIHRSDGVHARLFRAAAQHAQRVFAPLLASGAVAGGVDGLLRLADDDPAAMQQQLHAQQLPPEYVQALDRGAASARAGVPLPGPAWWYPGGGWLAPADLVRAWLRWPGVAFRGGTAVAAIRPGGPGWQALDAAGAVLAEAAVMVLAGADDSTRLLAPHGAAGWPVQRSRGQVSGWTSGPAHGLRLPVAAGSYALPLAADALLCGATHDIDDSEAAAREADDAHNFARLARLTGLVPPPGAHARLSRVGWRLHSADRLPIAGAVPMPDLAADTLQQVPRLPGLYVLGALGSRGITLAPLLGEVLATRIVGMPAPLERRLAEAVDPARWMVRAVRQARQQET